MLYIRVLSSADLKSLLPLFSRQKAHSKLSAYDTWASRGRTRGPCAAKWRLVQPTHNGVLIGCVWKSLCCTHASGWGSVSCWLEGWRTTKTVWVGPGRESETLRAGGGEGEGWGRGGAGPLLAEEGETGRGPQHHWTGEEEEEVCWGEGGVEDISGAAGYRGGIKLPAQIVVSLW